MDLVFAPSQIETWPIDRLRPYARNAKIHSTDQVAKIAASMAKFGWTVPCMVADDGELIAGHGRVLAAAMLGLKDVPVIRLSHLDEAERRAYRIADSKPANAIRPRDMENADRTWRMGRGHVARRDRGALGRRFRPVAAGHHRRGSGSR